MTNSRPSDLAEARKDYAEANKTLQNLNRINTKDKSSAALKRQMQSDAAAKKYDAASTIIANTASERSIRSNIHRHKKEITDCNKKFDKARKNYKNCKRKILIAEALQTNPIERAIKPLETIVNDNLQEIMRKELNVKGYVMGKHAELAEIEKVMAEMKKYSTTKDFINAQNEQVKIFGEEMRTEKANIKKLEVQIRTEQMALRKQSKNKESKDVNNTNAGTATNTSGSYHISGKEIRRKTDHGPMTPGIVSTIHKQRETR